MTAACGQILYPSRLHCSSFTPGNSVCLRLLFVCACERFQGTVIAPQLGESCDVWCAHASIWRKPAGGSGLLEEVKDSRQDEQPSQPLQVDGGRASVQ